MRSSKLNSDIGLLVAGIGVAQSIYLTVHSFLDRRKEAKNLLLGLFFLTISIRILKSMLWVYLEYTPVWLINAGFIAHSATGPLLYLYTLQFMKTRKWSDTSFVHFIPTVLLCFFMFSLTLHNFWYLGGYTVLLIQQMGYTLLAVVVLSRGIFRVSASWEREMRNKNSRIWIAVLVLGTLFLQGAYFSNYVLGLTPYLLGPIVYSVFAYFMAFFLFRNPQVLRSPFTKAKYQNIHMNEDDFEGYIRQITHFMTLEKPYLESSCTIGHIADQLNMPSYIISFVINKNYGQNFTDFINTYRIEESKILLGDKAYQNSKISHIAYDAGFNSLSSFNAAFKKQTGMTPSYFRKRLPDL